MRNDFSVSWTAIGCIALFAAMAVPASAADLESYGYVRTLEGAATILQGQERLDAEENQPLLAGDRVVTARSSRAELVLPDRTMVRLGPDAELILDGLAYSADAAAAETLLFLQRGAIQVTVPTDTLGGVLPRIDTGNATVYAQSAGSFRIEAWSDQTQLVVREGTAEVYTRTGTRMVRAGEEAWIQGTDRATVQVRVASALDGLERWGQRLDAEAAAADLRYVDSDLRYAAAPLARHGRWTYVDSRPVWRPYVSAGWTPYRHGRWVHTPSGLTWVSYEPWGWMTYHYGTWDLVPSYGWVWFPGRVYAPAWVYWYWGPTHVGWCPTGFYWRFYHGPSWHFAYRPGFRFHFGVHGWAGGRTRHFHHWTFVESRRLDDRRLAHHTRSGAQLQNQGRHELPRGVIATDTRSLRPEMAARPQDGMRTLQTRPAVAAGGTRSGGELPDISRVIARDPAASEGERRAAIPISEAGSRETPGRGATAVRPGAVGAGEGAAGRPGVGGSGAEGRQPGRVARPADGSGDGAASSSGAAGSRPGVQTRPAPRTDGDAGDAWRSQGRPERGGATGGAVTRPGVAAPTPRSEGGDAASGRVQALPAQRPNAGTGAASDSAARAPQRPAASRPAPAPTRPSSTAPSPRDDWRTGGRPGVTGARPSQSGASSSPPVRRVVEGVRSNRDAGERPQAPAATSPPARQGGAASAPARPPVRPQAPAAQAPQGRQGGTASAPARPPVRPQAPAASAPQGRQGGAASAPSRSSGAPRAVSGPSRGDSGGQAASSGSGSRSSSRSARPARSRPNDSDGDSE